MDQVLSTCHICGRPGLSSWFPATTGLPLTPTTAGIWGVGQQMGACSVSLPLNEKTQLPGHMNHGLAANWSCVAGGNRMAEEQNNPMNEESERFSVSAVVGRSVVAAVTR